MSQFFDSLESRTFLTASPTILADKAAIVAEVKHILSDKAAIHVDLVQARAEFGLGTKIDDLKALVADLKQLRLDVHDKAPAATITADKAAIASAKSTIKADAISFLGDLKTISLDGLSTLKSDALTLKGLVEKLIADRKAGL